MEHCGLYFSQVHIKTAQKYAKREPFKQAWEHLRTHQPLDLLSSSQWNGLRYRFDDDKTSGEIAVSNLRDHLLLSVEEDTPYIDGVMITLVMAQCFELVRDHPTYSPAAQEQWRETFIQRVSHLNTIATDELLQVERIWQNLMNLAAGIVLEEESIINQAVAYFHSIVDKEIRPQGFLPQAVEGKDGGSLLRMLLSVKGLVLMAEAAKQIDIDLWSIQNRGVSVVTAALYPLYYYYYPEKWQWDEGIELEEAQRLFKLHGSYLEPLNLHIGRETRAIDLILKEIRPIYDLWGGGLMTLSHGVPKRRGLFG
jgi:hypothetical protein